jgi:hypothetical protein
MNKTAMHKRLNAISKYKQFRKAGQSHSEAIDSLKVFDYPSSHIRKCDHSPFKSELRIP